MAGQPGFFNADDRLWWLSAFGGLLERLRAYRAPAQILRPPDVMQVVLLPSKLYLWALGERIGCLRCGWTLGTGRAVALRMPSGDRQGPSGLGACRPDWASAADARDADRATFLDDGVSQCSAPHCA